MWLVDVGGWVVYVVGGCSASLSGSLRVSLFDRCRFGGRFGRLAVLGVVVSVTVFVTFAIYASFSLRLRFSLRLVFVLVG